MRPPSWTWPMSALALVAIVALALMGCAASVTGAPTLSTATNPPLPTVALSPTASPTLTVYAPPCGASQLTMVTIAEGAASGHTATLLRFTNIGQAACSLQGYPNLRLLDSSDHPLDVHVEGKPDAYLWMSAPLNTIELPANGSAYARVETHNAPQQPGESCVTAATTLIYPPHVSRGFAATLKFTTCDGLVYVSSVVAQIADL